jgi:repressor LexA
MMERSGLPDLDDQYLEQDAYLVDGTGLDDGTVPDDDPDQGLTRRQHEIIQIIKASVRANGYAPSYREIGERVGLSSPSSVAYQVAELKKKGYLRSAAKRSRTTVVQGPAPGPGYVEVPLMWKIAAGGPIFAPSLTREDAEDVISLPEQLVGKGDLIMLRVSGDSMINAAITDGDLVVVRRETDVCNGDIVVAMLRSDTSSDGEVTVKTLRKLDGHVWLMPQNPAYDPILGDKATIIGKVVTVMRKL